MTTIFTNALAIWVWLCYYNDDTTNSLTVFPILCDLLIKPISLHSYTCVIST